MKNDYIFCKRDAPLLAWNYDVTSAYNGINGGLKVKLWP